MLPLLLHKKRKANGAEGCGNRGLNLSRGIKKKAQRGIPTCGVKEGE